MYTRLKESLNIENIKTGRSFINMIDNRLYSAQSKVCKLLSQPVLGTYQFEEKNGINYRKINPSDNEIEGQVEYRLNKDFYRSINFSEKPEILALGCSMTYGTGLPYDAIWPNILANKMNIKAGIIGLPGNGIEKIIASAMGIMQKYDYKPKYIFAIFPNFERLRYVDEDCGGVHDSFISYKSPKIKYDSTKDSLDSILPQEYVLFKNMSYINILDSFCKMSGIKFLWTSWAEYYSRDLFEGMPGFIFDETINEFPSYGYGPEWTPDENIKKGYYQYSHMNCHSEEESKYKDFFYYAYDNRKPKFHSGKYRFGPHPGMHRNIHWAELFYQQVSESAII